MNRQPPPDYRIVPLTLERHNQLLNELERFWLSKAPTAANHLTPVYPLLFSGFSFLLCQGETIASYLYGAHNNNKGFLVSIATRPEFYRRGYGTALLSYWEKAARKKGLRSLWAYTTPDNLQSPPFLQCNGFIIRKEIRILSDENRVLFKKELR